MAASDLITTAELKEYLAIAGTGQDTALGGVITRETAAIETYLDRDLVTRGAITEYHLGAFSHAEGVELGHDIYLRQWPIITVTSVHEGSRTYDATTLLAVTDYVANLAGGRLTRVAGATGDPEVWTSAYRGIRVVYTAGYATTSVVPSAIKDICLRLCALEWAEIERKQHGVSSMSDGLGGVTRYSAARLTPDMKDALAPYARREFIQTGEQDAA